MKNAKPMVTRLGEKIVLRVPGNGADEFDETGDDAEEQADKIEPRCVQPAVEGGAKEPSDYYGRGEDDC
jgi:hypothetical protein